MFRVDDSISKENQKLFADLKFSIFVKFKLHILFLYQALASIKQLSFNIDNTVLGPHIFLLYVNDFSSNISTTEKVIQFADDASIVCCGQKGSLHGKVTEILQKTEEYVEMNKLTLNTNKTELIFFSGDNSDFGSIFYKNEVLTTQKSCRCLGIQIDKNLSFEEQLNKTLKKIAHAIRSIYVIRHQVPLNARILLLKSLVLSHLSFSATFFQNLSAKNLKRLNRQINWGIKVCFLRKKYDKARDLLI